ncbi:hypothetical protein [Legionella brunensis]|uniref:Dot/Icm T4SS effector n=1 Tax=Legionella brunensis TaxID=29422 RepID=A0A0W0S3Q9_9GAMM|nr:hypothetical protein [Legionella brunensis]KTC78215.1 Dot/Icm T4SS effector [Legionella brunensis]
MAIRVLSFDFDGCLYHRGYIYNFNDKEKYVLEANRKFLDAIKKDNGHYTRNIGFVGSNRQSKSIDLVNGKESCFVTIQQIVEDLGIELDKFLMADLYGNLAAGESFNRAIDADTPWDQHVEWKFDDTKASLIYAQVQKIAQENPDEEIVFEFFDDRGKGARRTEDILEWLNKFYSENPEMLPKNVTLKLNHYSGEEVTPLFEIKGTGIIDADYRQTVKDMAEAATPDYEGKLLIGVDPGIKVKELKRTAFVVGEKKSKETNVAEVSTTSTNDDGSEHSSVKQEEKKTAQTTKKPAERKSQAEMLFDEQLEIIKTKAAELCTREGITEDESEQQDELSAAGEAVKLYKALKAAGEGYFHGIDSRSKFKKQCGDAIEAARPKLEEHRGWKEFFANLASVIVSVLSVGIVNYATGKGALGLFPVKTDSAQKLDNLEESVVTIASLA